MRLPVRPLLPLLFGLAAVAAAQGYPAEVELPPVHPATHAYEVRPLLEGLPVPVSAVPLDDGSGRLLVVSLAGRVWLTDVSGEGAEPGGVRERPFLDLFSRVTAMEGEQGLFSVALEPAESAARRGGERLLAASFTEKGTGDVVVAVYPVAPDLSSADPTGERLLLRVPVEEPFHHGGQVAFGPDGMLYASIGSGERSVAALHRTPPTSQDLRSLRGKLLRIDPFGGDPYAVPDDNPFTPSSDFAAAAMGAREEIWALGFRNPWKFTFGPEGELFLADVGEDRWEEVNRIEPGGNYGWPAREGSECLFFPDAPGHVQPGCPEMSFADPVVEYAHLALDPQGGQSVTGGVVVTDPQLPELLGKYVYGDFVTGRVWSFDPATDRVELLLDTDLALTEIAAGEDGEVLLISVSGALARLVRLP